MSFLDEPSVTHEVRTLYDADLAGEGYVMNLTRVWAHRPDAKDAFTALLALVAGDLTLRERGILVAATASTLGDSYCSLAWGNRLAGAAEPEVAAAVLAGTDEGLTETESALATWARAVTREPGATTPADVDALRAVGYDDAQVLALSSYVALRVAFSTINAALGARPDRELVERAPAAVLDAVTWGRRADGPADDTTAPVAADDYKIAPGA